MAMRGRGGRGNPSRPPRAIVGRKYEQFKPMSEWRQEDGYDTLLIYLPGFQKEFIKVTTEELNIVRVRGERLVAENKWSRFQEDYRVPENCEMRGIRAKFDGGILTITMPRKATTTAPPPPPPPPPPVTTTTQHPPKTKEQPVKRTRQEEALPELKEEPKEKKPVKPQTVEPPPPPPAPTPTPPTTVTTQLPPKPEQPKEKKSDKPQATPPLEVGESTNTLPKPSSTSDPKEVVPYTIGSLPKYTPQQDKHHTVEKPSVKEKTELDKGRQKEALHEEGTKRDLKGSKGKTNYTGETSGGFKAGWRVNEDRKALVNVGVGVLVIVALGVHVSYTIGLLTKGK